MGFYHPATLVKDAQRHGVRFAPIDVQVSDWDCRVEPDGRVRLGLMYVNGLRAETGRAIAERMRPERGAGGKPAGGGPPSESERGWGPASTDECRQMPELSRCPKCGCDDPSMLETTPEATYFCNICAHEWRDVPSTDHRVPSTGFTSIEDLIAKTGVRRDELATLAEIGALNALGYDRRSAQWQIEKAVRPAGELFEPLADSEESPHLSMRVGPHISHCAGAPPPARAEGSRSLTLGGAADAALHSVASRGPQAPPRTPHPAPRQESPLRPMSPPERLMADYAGTSLTIGPHPMALRRQELALRGVLRATDLTRGRHGRRVRVAGAVITRQRPGTAKGFVFLTLEDETGISNIIVRPDLFAEYRRTIVGAPYLLVEGILQIQEGVTSVKAEQVVSLTGTGPEAPSHDFH